MKPVAMDDFCSLSFLSNVEFSPSGTCACFTVTKALKKENKYASCLYLYKDGKARPLTTGGKESAFCFLSDDAVLFPSNREESKEPSIATRFYRISLSGGEAALAYTLPIPVQRLIPLKNGDFLALGTTFPGWEDLSDGDTKRTAAYLKHRKENADYEEITQNPWWWNGGTFTRGAYESLFYFEAKKNRLTRLTETGLNIGNVKLSADERFVYFVAQDATAQHPTFYEDTLWRIELASRKAEKIVQGRRDFMLHTYELGASFLLLAASDGHLGMNTDPDFYTVAYETWEVSPYAVYGNALGSSVGSDVRYGGGHALRMEGDTLYFISTRFDGSGVYKLENGAVTPVVERPGSVDCFDVRGGKLLLVALWNMKAQELYDETGKQLSRFNEKPLRSKYIAQPEPLCFTTGGHEVHGFVLKPFGFEKGKKYPVILDVHGGPKTVYGPVFYHEMQLWAGMGYFVIFCNPTGSDGRGEFMDIIGKYGTVDYDDLMAFCDAALRAYPEMDEANFFETGGSYGGFMTNWIIGHTDRFRACASQRSISNWVSFFGVSDIGVDFTVDQCAGTIWPSPEKLWQHSPLKYADRCKTPTLFIHAFEDYRCPIDQGYQMYTALAAHGVEAKMVCFRGENHELSRSGKPLHRIKRLEEITAWFEKHRGE